MSPHRVDASDRFIPFARPSIGPREEEAVIEVLRSGWLTTGAKATEFERRFAEYTGAAHAVAVSSGTAGLHLSLEALGVQPGDQVVTTPYTFTATAETIRYLGADPLFVDIADDSFNIDVDAFEAAAASHEIRCIVPVHVGGEPCDMRRIREIADRYGIAVVEDAAHAFPSRVDGRYIGTFGNTGVYSFYANKTITTGEGGMIVTDDRGCADRMRTMRLHGIDRTVWDRYVTNRSRSWEYDIVAAGYKYNLPDTAAAIGLVQLDRAETFLDRRRAIAARYTEGFRARDYLIPPRDASGHAWHLYILRLRLERLSIDRDAFVEGLSERGIGTSVHYKPLHHMSYYRDTYGLEPGCFPRASERFAQVLSLPIYPDLSDDAVDHIIDSVLEIGDESYVGLREE